MCFKKIHIALAIISVCVFLSTAPANDILELSAEQESFLKSLIPQVSKPKPTEEQLEQGFITYWADATSNFYTNVPPPAEDLERKPVVRTPAGEDEPLLLGVWGLRKMDYATLRVKKPFFETTVRGVPAQGGVYPVNRISTYYPGNLRSIPGHPSDKPQPEPLGKLGIPYFIHPNPDLAVEPDLTAFFWINVTVPEGTAPGEYKGELELLLANKAKSVGQTTGYAFARRISLPFTVEVLPIKLPRADIAYGAWFRPLTKLPQEYQTDGLMMEYYRDMARHGHTSIGYYPGESIWDKEGHVTLDGRKSTKQVEMMIEAGLLHRDIPFLWLGAPDLEPEQSKWYAAEFRAEVKKRGWPDPLQYGWDEPPASDHPNLHKHFNQRDHFRPALHTVTAIGREAAEKWGKHLDVWIVHNEFPKSPQLFEHFKTLAASHDAELWVYDCAHRGTNPTWSRYSAGVYTWATAVKGNFIWCYGESSMWGTTMAKAWEPLFVRVQPSLFGPVSSVGWEARREGIEDYRYLRQLEKVCETASPAKSAKARTWLAKLRKRVLETVIPNIPDYAAFQVWDTRDLWTECPQFARGELTKIRNEAIELLLELQEN